MGENIVSEEERVHLTNQNNESLEQIVSERSEKHNARRNNLSLKHFEPGLTKMRSQITIFVVMSVENNKMLLRVACLL